MTKRKRRPMEDLIRERAGTGTFSGVMEVDPERHRQYLDKSEWMRRRPQGER